MDPLGFDPMPSMLSALEKQIESTTVPDPPIMDPMSQMLGQLEATIEGTTTTPPKQEEPDFFSPTLPSQPSLAVGGPRSPDPPPSPESTSHVRTAIAPPLAARPFFAHDGLSLEPYRPHPGSNPGSLGRTSVPTRWCPDRGEAVEVAACEECDKWGEHDGDGVEQCYYDWQEQRDGQNENEGAE
jgi:hypothetical protein